MKQKLKEIYSLIVICMIFAFCSCQDDFDDSHHHQNNQKIKITEKKFEELILDTKFKNAYNEISKSKNLNLNAKTVMENNYNFTISDLPAKVIENGNKISYTFHITRDSDDVGYFENLVVGIDSLNQTTAFIAKYQIDETKTELINNMPFKDVIYQTIIFNYNTTARITPCMQVRISRCNGSPYDCGGGICGYDYTVSCVDDGGGGGGGIFEPTIGTDTTPIGSGGIRITQKNPCVLLNKLKNDVAFKAKMTGLKNAAEQWGFEKCHTVYNDPTPNIQAGQIDKFDYEDFAGTVDKPEANYTGNTSMQGIIHSHYAGLVSIFSPGDLADLYNMLLNPQISDDFFIGLVTKKGVAYILQIPDRQAFLAFGNQYLANESKLRKFMEDKYLEKYQITADNPASTNEKAFLKMMSELGASVSLASTSFAPNTPTFPDLFNNWTKKIYDGDFNTVKSSNCY